MSIDPLKFLHPAESLNKVKLMQIDKMSTEEILDSLMPGVPGCLKARRDGTVLDGHHRLHILHQRGIRVDHLEREIILKESSGDVD